MNNPHKFPSFKKWFCDLEDWRQNPLFPESHVCCSIHNVSLTTFACFRIPRSLFICPAENWLLWLLILEVVKLTESFLRGSLELIYSYPFRSNFKELKKEESELNRDLRHNPYCLQMHTCDWITTVQLDNLCLLRN